MAIEAGLSRVALLLSLGLPLASVSVMARVDSSADLSSSVGQSGMASAGMVHLGSVWSHLFQQAGLGLFTHHLAASCWATQAKRPVQIQGTRK